MKSQYVQLSLVPASKEKLTLRSGRGAHWLTFTLEGDYGYIAPIKNSDDDTEIFSARTHTSASVIGSSEDMLEIDFLNGKISRVGDQYGIGRSSAAIAAPAQLNSGCDCAVTHVSSPTI